MVQDSASPMASKPLESIRDVLKDAKIIPDVLKDFDPSCHLQVLYPSSHKQVLMGNELKPSEAQNAPIIKFTCPALAQQSGAQFTIVLTDPDAPSRDDHKWSEFCHWIAVLPPSDQMNFLNNDPRAQEILVDFEGTKMDQIVEYYPPAPPKKTRLHRYVFVLLSGDNSNLEAPSERKNWGTGKASYGVQDWANQQNLTVVSANFFYAQNGIQ